MHEAAQSLLAHAEAHLPRALAVRQQKALGIFMTNAELLFYGVRYHHDANLSRECWLLLSDSSRSMKKLLELDAPLKIK